VVLRIVRLVVRRATPAALPGVRGRPTFAIASDDTEPAVTKEIGSIWTNRAKVKARTIELRNVNFVIIISSLLVSFAFHSDDFSPPIRASTQKIPISLDKGACADHSPALDSFPYYNLGSSNLIAIKTGKIAYQ
jgi:hypothetical protein